MKSDFAKFKKIDAHSHIGKFGSPFDVNFDAAMLREQMAEYSIEKTILCPAAASLNAELLSVWKQMPDQVIPLYWVNANLGQPAYEELEHYLRDLGFAGVKMQPLF
ncbi:MAG: amidohydrolase, partial [Lentisphaeria bacterium]|nr:amidohydrolase [Lentisphaeria bacterium]